MCEGAASPAVGCVGFNATVRNSYGTTIVDCCAVRLNNSLHSFKPGSRLNFFRWAGTR